MISIKATRILALLSLVLSALVVPQQTADAKGGGSSVRMIARLAGVKAVAKYEERGTRLKFNFQLELGTPGQVGSVTAVAANGSTVEMGTFTVDALRRGIIDIDNTEGDSVPDLNVGSLITLKINGNTYTGTLQLR